MGKNRDIHPRMGARLEDARREKIEKIKAANREAIAYIDKAIMAIRIDGQNFLSEQGSLAIEDLEYYKSIVESLEVTTEHSRKLTDIILPGIASIETFFQINFRDDNSMQ
jgi:hypothetical protein